MLRKNGQLEALLASVTEVARSSLKDLMLMPCLCSPLGWTASLGRSRRVVFDFEIRFMLQTPTQVIGPQSNLS